MYEGRQNIRKSNLLKSEDIDQIKYIEHLGKEPYNKIYFFNQKPKVVSYSLAYWHSILGRDFERLNKKYLVRKGIIEKVNKDSSILVCGTEIKITARQLKKYNVK
jgi:hypothetical protein